jgi:hypothetical protein
VWAHSRTGRAERLVLARVVEARSLLRHVEAAVPGATIIVVALRAPAEVLRPRLQAR